MVQKNLEGQWETTGIIGRVGHLAKIVTNVCKGGVSKPVEVLLKEHVTDVPGIGVNSVEVPAWSMDTMELRNKIGI